MSFLLSAFQNLAPLSKAQPEPQTTQVQVPSSAKKNAAIVQRNKLDSINTSHETGSIACHRSCPLDHREIDN